MSYSVRREEMEGLEPEWRSLIPRSSLRHVFVSPTWMRAWWGEFAQGREQMLLAVRKGRELVGVVPLMRDGERLCFIGDTQVCDYMDLTVAEGAEKSVAFALLRALAEEPWRELVLWALPDYSPTLRELPAAAQAMGLAVHTEVEDVCPQVSLPSTWEAYLDGLSRKDRHELRRKLRRLTKDYEVDTQELTDSAEVSGALDEFLHLHTSSRIEKARFMTEPMKRFFRRVVTALADEGLVHLYFLTLDGVRAAAVLCFNGPNDLLLYNSGYDRAYASLSVGLISKAMAIKQAIASQKTCLDFLRGAEPYKYDLGAHDLNVNRMVIQRP
jgi:CelD/BcsL family acetyltransferase involved in cellulose biosynthesis